MLASRTDDAIRDEIDALTQIVACGAHRNLVEIRGHGWRQIPEYDLGFYIIDMELCGQTLREYIDESRSQVFPQRGLDMTEVWTIMLHICSGLSFLHDHGLIHCDLKPSNSMSPLPSISY